MTSTTGYGRAVLLMLAAGVGMASVLPAGAQTVPSSEEPEASATEAAAAPDAEDADIRDLQLDWSQLNVDASTLTTAPASKLRLPPRAGSEMSWSSRDRPNGSAAVTVKQPLSPFWDARLGADMTVTRQPPTTMSELLSEKLANGGNAPQSSGAAWAAVTRRRPDLGQDRDRGPRRSLAGSEQARHLHQQVAAAERAVFAHPAGRLQRHPAGHRAAAGHRRAPDLSNRAIGEAEHRRHRHQSDCRPDALHRRRQMASQGRRRAEIVRRRQHLGLRRRNPAGHDEQEPHRGIQAQLVSADLAAAPARSRERSSIAVYWPRCGQNRQH
jgi:hypothetical protein